MTGKKEEKKIHVTHLEKYLIEKLNTATYISKVNFNNDDYKSIVELIAFYKGKSIFLEKQLMGYKEQIEYPESERESKFILVTAQRDRLLSLWKEAFSKIHTSTGPLSLVCVIRKAQADCIEIERTFQRRRIISADPE